MESFMHVYGIYLFAGLLLAWVIWSRFVGPRLAGVRSISAAAYHEQWRHQKHTLLDVRSPGEYASQHAPDALLIPLSELRQGLNKIDKSIPVVCICASGVRSSMAASTLAKSGVEAVYNFSGGMAAWASAGLPVQKGR